MKIDRETELILQNYLEIANEEGLNEMDYALDMPLLENLLKKLVEELECLTDE